jgi:hypothetical protein
MIDVIQVFKSEERFRKTNYPKNKFELLDQWQEKLTSRTGYLLGQTLHLPRVENQKPDIEKAQLLIIVDRVGVKDPFLIEKPGSEKHIPRWHKDSDKLHSLWIYEEAICYYKLANVLAFEIFRIEKTDPETFALYLNYSSNSLSIGIPERSNHKVGVFGKDKLLRYRLNGKSDFTMSGRKDRSFVEYDFVLRYLGQAEKVEFQEINQMEREKVIAARDCRIVDERKILK